MTNSSEVIDGSTWSCIDMDRVEIKNETVYLFFKDEYSCCPEKLTLSKAEIIKLCKALGVTSLD